LIILIVKKNIKLKDRRTAPKYRKTTWFYPDQTLNEQWVIKQQKTDNIDVPELNLRFSAQSEQTVPTAVEDDLQLESIREKTRTSFTDPDEIIYLDFTVATTTIIGREPKISYEVEVELRQEKMDEQYRDQFFDLITQVIAAVQQSEKVITVTVKDQVISDFNKLFKVEKRNLHNYFFPKPIDLQWGNFKEMFRQFKYNVTEKSDGTRSFLFIHAEGVFIIQPPFIVNQLGPHTAETHGLVGSLFDCEYVKEKTDNKPHILIFDTLFYKGENMRNAAFYPRLSKARELTAPTQPNNPANFAVLTSYQYNAKITISVKAFYFFTTADEMFAVINKLQTTVREQAWENDGFIFTPTNEGYYMSKGGIFKYKPVEKLTIDFLIKNGQPYSYTGEMGVDGKPEYVLFQGTDEFPLGPQEIMYQGKLVNSNVIYECRYNKFSGQFYILRNRPDRTTANGIQVAKSVWANIINPIGDAINGNTLKFYSRAMDIARIKLLSKYTGKRVLDVNTKKDSIFLEAANMDVDLYSLNPADCVADSMVAPRDKMIFPGEDFLVARFDAISCFFNLNMYDNPETIFQIADKMLPVGGKVFGIFMDVSDLTEQDLEKFTKIKFAPKYIDDSPAFSMYIQPRTIENMDAIPMNRYVLSPRYLEKMANHYGFRAKFQSSTTAKPEFDTQDNYLFGIQTQFVFEKVAGMSGPIPNGVKTPPFLEGKTPADFPDSPVLQHPESPPYMPESPPYMPESPQYRPQTPPNMLEAPPYRPGSPTLQQTTGRVSPPGMKRGPPRLPV